MPMLILYTRPDCHLCEEALACIEAAEIGRDVREIDIDSDPALSGCYGVRIPVLHDERSGNELGWPFTPADVQAFMRQHGDASGQSQGIGY